MADLVALRIANARRWTAAKLTRSFTLVATHLVDPSAKQRYLTVTGRTGVPWWFIAIVHERESSQNWRGSLAQGDPFDRVSVHVPAGRGPFKSWEDAAVDALVNCAPFTARNKDWSAGGAMTMAEEYNGLGYANGPHDKETGITYPPQPSPYVWSGTDQYHSGKYVRDGVYNPNAVDQQLGCAGLLKTMMQLDPTITFTGVVLQPRPASPPQTPSPPLAPAQPKPSLIASIISAVLSIFRKGK